VCDLCCEERLSVEQSTFDNYNYLISTNNENIYNFIKDIPLEIKNKIISDFEFVTEHEKKSRGDNKKAILAVSYFFNITNQIIADTEKDAYKKFFLTKKKFGIGKKLFLKHFKKYNDIDVFISSYVKNVFSKFPNTISEITILYICKYVDNYKKLANFNPYTVCACILLYFLLEQASNDNTHITNIYDSNQIKKIFKRNIYLKIIGMSDIIVKSINKVLIPKIEEYILNITLIQKHFKHTQNNKKIII